MPSDVLPLAQLLARHTREGELVERLPDGRVRCVACGHRCVVPPGREGVCRVRFNVDGVLRVPWGYAAGLQLDPVEKKPFFHALPGARALSFGMLGCDYHCSYCFSGDTMVATEAGLLTLAELFASCSRKQMRPDAELGFPEGTRVVTGSGRMKPLLGVVRHRYRGEMARLRPFYLPAIRCTPDHRVYATDDPSQPPSPVPARELTSAHYLAVPRVIEEAEPRPLLVHDHLAAHRFRYRVRWDLSDEEREYVRAASAAGQTSRAIGLALGKDPSYVRHVRGKIARGRGGRYRTGGLSLEGGAVRFPGEHRPGIRAELPVDADLAALLGYYCAEGCVVRSAARPNSYTLSFSFSRAETALADRVRALLGRCLGLEAQLVERDTTLAVCVGKSSAALLLQSLAGGHSSKKRVPSVIATAGAGVVKAFLDAYVEGDGHRYSNGKVSATTVSRALAHGIAWLVLRSGFLPSLYANAVGPVGLVQGRRVRRKPVQYTVAWYEGGRRRRRMVETVDHYLVPIREVGVEEWDDHVYNMEVEGEHSYLAGLAAVSNCQNWVTSQALRDKDAVAPAQEVTPDEIVRIALEEKARIVTSTYNEPLITSEWGMAVFRAAREAGLVCSYVSNGNGTEEVLEYIRPFVRLYKVDLKGFRDRPYRDLGGTLDRVLATIRSLYEKGFWLEVVTLVVPGHNDSPEELTDIARFLVSVSPDIPWHVTAFHPDYRMEDRGSTPAHTLLEAAEIGVREGLHFVYAGNLPGGVDRWEDTRCPGCRAVLVERVGFRVRGNRIGADGRCPDCGRSIPGVWA